MENKAVNHTLKNTHTLNDYNDFCSWYLNAHDLSMFLETDIDELLAEIKPNSYPCLPIYSNDMCGIIFAEVKHIENWFEAVKR